MELKGSCTDGLRHPLHQCGEIRMEISWKWSPPSECTGPLLFISDIPDGLTNYVCIFAVDTKIIGPIKSQSQKDSKQDDLNEAKKMVRQMATPFQLKQLQRPPRQKIKHIDCLSDEWNRLTGSTRREELVGGDRFRTQIPQACFSSCTKSKSDTWN